VLGSPPAYAQDAVAAAGKQRAASSPVEWQVREANHPALGPIRFAFLRNHIVTSVGHLKVFSRPYVSCEKNAGKIAIEVTHGMSPQDANGLQPKTVPVLTCSGPPLNEIPARWGINALGDVLARGLSPSQLRQCASINVEQDVALPQAPGTARVVFEIAPYDKVLDAIFATCGETTAYAEAERSALEKSTPAPISTWRTVRTTSSGKTNVRARPTTDSPVVLQLDGGAIVTVQHLGGDWWRARSSGGKTFDGYIRQDRLVLE
jgi:hypothetical protein